MFEFIICDKVSRNRFAIIRSKQLSGCMPQLSTVVWHLGIKLVFEGSVASTQLAVKFRLVCHTVEIKGLARVEDHGLVGKVAIVWIVKAV